MNVYSLIAGIALFGVGALSGIYLSGLYSKRLKFYNSLLEFNRDLITCISFHQDDLSIATQKEYNCDGFNDLVKSKADKLKGKKVAYSFPTYLNKNEVYEITKYLNDLGNQDKKTQINLLNQYEQIFKQKLVELKSDNDKKGGLYKKMGVIIGLITFIIVI